MPLFASTSLGITGTTTLTCQRSQVGVLSRPSPECSNACLIAPTGRTRCDPDHRVTDLRRGVAESPSAESENRRAQALGGSSPPPSAAPCSLRSTLRLPHRLPPNSLLTRRKIPYHIPLVSLPVFVFCRLGW